MNQTKEKQLNPAQTEAVHHTEGPCLTIAGPGSGKTSVITARVEFLIRSHHVDPSHILVITFTRAAATEMKQRFLEQCGRKTTGVYFGTFHALFFMILRQAYGYQGTDIVQEEKKREILKEIISRFPSLEYEDEADFLSDLVREISLVKNDEIPLEHYYSTTCPEHVFREIFAAYQNALVSQRRLDFDDMMIYCKELLVQRQDILKKWQERFLYLLVDEFQDINKLQYEIVRLLAGKRQNLFIVGDDDQSIYQFRGARPKLMLEFPKDYPGCHKITLDINYRCSKNILEAAGRLIKQNQIRFPKHLKTVKEEGKPVVYQVFSNPKEEQEYVLSMLTSAVKNGSEYRDFAILYRTRLQPRRLAERLMDDRIPFVMKDFLPNIYDHWISRDFLTYFRVAHGSRKRKDILQIINRPNRYIKREYLDEAEISFEDLIELYEEQHQDWMGDRIEEFLEHMAFLERLSPYSGIHFILHGIGYEIYVKEAAKRRKLSEEDLFEIIDEIMDAAKEYPTYEEWLAHIEQYRQELEEQQKKEPSSRSTEENAVTLMTMHSAKGLEFQNVILIDANEEITPHKKSVSEAEIEEERRMFYVAMTRAKQELYIFSVQERFDKELEISRFVKESRRELPEGQKAQQKTLDGKIYSQRILAKPTGSGLKKGDRIVHRRFGEGIVREAEDGKALVVFDRTGQKVALNLEYCLAKGIISVLS